MLLVAIDNLTKWVEALSVARIDAPTTAQFLFKHVYTVMGVLSILSPTMDQILRQT